MKIIAFLLNTCIAIILVVGAVFITGCTPETVTSTTTQIVSLPTETVTTTTTQIITITHTTIPTSSELFLIEQLGKEIFFDRNLSSSGAQSCATCHGIAVGFTGPKADINAAGTVYPGAVDTLFGNRKPPTAAYGNDSPVLYYDEAEGIWIGGMFWDGRATGWTMGDPLAEQAQGPFLNPLEQNLPDAYSVCIKVAQSDYADLFKRVWGENSLDLSLVNVEEIYNNIARSISAYEKSLEVNPFSSKYDVYLAGNTELTEQEALGLQLFKGKAKCSYCHISQPDELGNPPVFTDFTYDNLGIPKNPENPFYQMPEEYNPDGDSWVDPGLGGFLKTAGYPADVYEPELGKHKNPTLRNVDMRPYPGFIKAYGHNGYFKSLEDIVHFFNTRDVEVWPSPEYMATVNNVELGNLGLSAEEEAAIVAFLKTLSDGYIPYSPPNTTTTTTTALTTTWGELAVMGQRVFLSICAVCHGDEGQGGDGPQNIGPVLRAYSTAKRLFGFISTAAPMDGPSSLSDNKYQQLLAFMLVESNLVQPGLIFDKNNLADVLLNE
ncbi:cytochrome c peroxidase [Chloroflexota bacterium]